MSAMIPEKRYFRIGEVAKLAGIAPHVLRYWETEFKEIRPHRACSKQRLYTRRDVETILKIRILLKERGFTIAGAKKALHGESVNPEVMLQQLANKVDRAVTESGRAWQPFLPMMEEVIFSHNNGGRESLSTKQRLALLKQGLMELQRRIADHPGEKG